MIIKIKMTRPENIDYYGVRLGDTVPLELEDYLCGVVPSEVYEDSTHLQAKRAQAIAARSYAVWRSLHGGTLDDTSNSQNYRVSLVDGSPKCRQAVADTAGLVLMYGGEVAITYYSSSNAGLTKLPEGRGWQWQPYYDSVRDPWDDAARARAAGRGKEIRTGHGIGLSQAGAGWAASTGVSLTEILGFYYPGAYIARLNGDDEMAKPLASQVRAKAVSYATRNPPIPYVLGGESETKQDCQGHIECSVRAAGGTMSYAGSNDMFRNACSWVGTMAEARAQGNLVPGTLIFQVNPSPSPDAYPAKYHGDGKGDAYHVGFYWGEKDVPQTNAAAGSLMRVTVGELHDRWNYVGLAKAIDYSEYLGTAAPEIPADDDISVMATVTTVKDPLNMRAGPGTSYGVVAKLPRMTDIIITKMQMVDGQAWGKTQYMAAGTLVTGWVSMQYVTVRREEDVVPEQPPEPDDDVLLQARGHLLEAARLLDVAMGVE